MAYIDEMTIVVQRNPGRKRPVAAFTPELHDDEGVEADTVLDAVFEQAEKITEYMNKTNPDCTV